VTEANGNVKWRHLVTAWISILGIVAGMLTWGITQVAAIEQRSIVRDDALTICIHAYIIPMKEQISAISSKLGVN
jgi:hypothetical protein